MRIAIQPLVHQLLHRFRRCAWLVVPLALAACGGGGGGGNGSEPVDVCSVPARKVWLQNYMDDWYFWYRLAPRPNPAAFASVDEFFDASLYNGSDAAFPADRWSRSESTESFNRFFGDGRTLGYGLSVAGIEVRGEPSRPLWVRYVEPRSDAAAQGVRRGDQIVSLNGRPASEYIAADDFSVLSPGAAGTTLSLVLRGGGVDRLVTLVASVHDLTPVTATSIQTTAFGRRLGYVNVKDMVSQALSPLDTAFAQFRAAGVSDVVLDLRYNGGGLVSVAGAVSSYVAGPTVAGRPFATLLYNDKQSSSNQGFPFSSYSAAAGLRRVFVLMGPRTCSASEQVINGLRGVGIEVVAIGDTTCGKPVGFLPVSECGTTWNVVNFESVNERFEGRYFDGFAPTCPVAEDFTRALGDPTEPLLAAAREYADWGSCPPGISMRQSAGPRRPAASRKPEAGERQEMIPR